MKKKILLLLLAAALTISLAIGGTLMLFTAHTATATNVVTLSPGIEAQLWVYGGKLDPISPTSHSLPPYYVEYPGLEVGSNDTTLPPGVHNNTTGKFKGLTYVVAPNELIDNAPYVVRNDANGADAYLKLEVTLNFTNVSLSDIPAGDLALTTLFNNTLNTTNWTVEQNGNKFTFYYTSGGALAVFGNNDSTKDYPPYTQIHIPNFNAEFLNANSTVTVEANVTAYLVQSTWNDGTLYGDDGTELAHYFPA
ncbi:MAG: hypothetical protein LBN30_02600 [Oscillospiraceae bacterium]|jgi:hypothetical protein|nr:hypothetical protein [Oscillospiraceae bacterium]